MAEVKLTVLGEDKSQPAQTAIKNTTGAITALEALMKEFGSYVTALGSTVNKGLQGIESGFSSLQAKGANSMKSMVDASEEQINRLNALGKGVSDRLSPHFEALGLRSSQAIEAQRERAVSSYEAIKKSGVASADEITRAEKALQTKTAELDAELKGTIATTNKLDSEAKKTIATTNTWAGAVGMLKTALVALGITISAMALVNLAKDAALMAARYDTLGVTMNVVGNNAGYTAAKMDGFQQSLMKSGIAMNESRQNLTMMAQAQIDLTKSSELARIAQDAAVIGGINSSEAFTRMIYGIQSAQVEVLRTIGINVSFENSYKKLGTQLGKSAENLTEVEKAQARTNAVMEKGKDISGSYEAAMGTAGKQITSMQRYIDNLKITVGSVFNDALIVAVEGFTGALKAGNKEANEMAQKGQLKQWGQDLVIIMATLADGVGIAYSALNTLVLTGVAGLQELYYGATAFMQALNGDFSAAKDSFNTMLATGEAWAALVAKQWENSTKYQDAARKMFADRDNQANKSALLDKQNAAESERIAAGSAARAAEAVKAASLAKEKNLERELEAMKTEKAAESSLLKEHASIASDILKGQYDQGLVSTADYNEKIRQMSDTAAQQRFKETYDYLQKEKALLASVRQNKGESSSEYAKELNRNKQLIGEVALAWVGVEKAAGDAERQLISSAKAETEAYEKLNIATLEAAGYFEAAEQARQSLAQKSAEYLRMEIAAATGDVSAAKALSNQRRLDAISMVEGHNKTTDALAAYTQAAALAKDSVAALNGEDAEAIANGAKLRTGLDAEAKLRRDLSLAQVSGATAAVSSLSSQIQSQEILNQRLREEIALRERKGVLTGAIVGYNGNTPVYADSYAKSQAANGYVSNSQLMGIPQNTVNIIGNSPFVGLNDPWFGGARANGGDVKPYATYRINEDGTEYLTMGNKGGYITPANKSAGKNNGGLTLAAGAIQLIVQGGAPVDVDAMMDSITRKLLPKLDEYARRRRAA